MGEQRNTVRVSDVKDEWRKNTVHFFNFQQKTLQHINIAFLITKGLLRTEPEDILDLVLDLQVEKNLNLSLFLDGSNLDGIYYWKIPANKLKNISPRLENALLRLLKEEEIWLQHCKEKGPTNTNLETMQ